MEVSAQSVSESWNPDRGEYYVNWEIIGAALRDYPGESWSDASAAQSLRG